MPAKIKTNAAFKDLGKLLPDARSKFSKEMKRTIKEVILDEYRKGTSPVKGFNPYDSYADSTAKKKGRKKPVTLNETGALYNSLEVVQSGGGVNISIGKGLKNGYARYHQDGTDEMSARPLLPEKPKQEFKIGVFNKILAAAKKAIRDAARKFS